MEEQAYSFLRDGYVVYDVLSGQEAATLASSATDRFYGMCNRGVVDPKAVLDMFRAGKGASGAQRSAWEARFGIGRTYDRDTGLVNSFVAPWSVRLHADRRVVDVVSRLYDTRGREHELEGAPSGTSRRGVAAGRKGKGGGSLHVEAHPVGYTYGLGGYQMRLSGLGESSARVGRLPYGTTITEPADAWREEALLSSYAQSVANYPLLDGISTYVVSSVDAKVKENGQMEVLSGFHLYWEVMSSLVADQRMWESPTTSRFEHVVGVSERRFDSALEWFNEQLETYTRVYNAVERDEGTGDEEEIRDELVHVIEALAGEAEPTNRKRGHLPWCPREFAPLRWTSVGARAGQAVSVDTRTPSRYRPNRSAVTYTAHHLPLNEVRDGYYLSAQHGTIRAELTGNPFRGYRPRTNNDVECGWARSSLVPGQTFREYAEMMGELDDRQKQLLCIRPYPGLANAVPDCVRTGV
jgi:hypothetical protein